MIEKQIIQFSIGRSGSTMIWQILKLLFSEVKKVHSKEMRETYSKHEIPMVASYRDPRDTVVSLVRVIHFVENNDAIISGIDRKILSQYATEVKRREKDLDYWCNNYAGPVLLLQYERFYNDYEYIFLKLEDFFSIQINSETREKIIEQTSVSKNLERQKKMRTFSEHCPETHIHGNHINYPDPGSYKFFLNQGDQEWLNNQLHQEIKCWEQREDIEK